MAAVTITWDPTSPAGSTAISGGDDSIRVFKTGLVERLRNGGHQMQTAGATADTTDGRHCCGESNAAGSSELAGEFSVYAADKTTALYVFRDSTSAAATTAGNATGEFYAGALAIRTTGILKGATVEVSTLLKPAATADNGVQDNAIDIGVDATNRFRSLFLGSNAKIGGTLLVSGIATFTVQPVFSGGITVATQLYVNGGQRSAISINASGPVTLTTANRINLFSVISGGYSVNLPTAGGSNAGVEFYLTITAPSAGSAFVVTIDPSGAETINGTATLALRRQSAGDRYSCHIVSDSTNWQLISDMIA